MICLCGTCNLKAPAVGFDDCLECAVASLLVEDPAYLDFARKHFAGTDWLREFEREWERQLSALMACGRAA